MDCTDSAQLKADRTIDRTNVFTSDEARFWDNSHIFNLGLKRNQITTNLEMLTTGDACCRSSTSNNCLSFVTANFEFVWIHPSFDRLYTLVFCLFHKGTKISRRGRTEKLYHLKICENHNHTGRWCVKWAGYREQTILILTLILFGPQSPGFWWWMTCQLQQWLRICSRCMNVATEGQNQMFQK